MSILTLVRRFVGRRDYAAEAEREYEQGRALYAARLQGMVDLAETPEEREYFRQFKERALVEDGLRWAYIKHRCPL